MKFISTRNQSPAALLSESLSLGLASDGGLFVPEALPLFESLPEKFRGLEDTAAFMLQPFFEDDKLGPQLPSICKSTFKFEAPLVDLGQNISVLELFHGPTAAFKDFGARFLAQVLKRLHPKDPIQILVATSGDTGGAVAAAFHKINNIKVGILFPSGKVSKRQERQLTCWDKNITTFSVQGDFDDCQRLVKEAFNDENFRATHHLTSANSINIGRLLPQCVYYAKASLDYVSKHKEKPGFIIPTGNLGNAVAAFWARAMGFPIREIVLSCNANDSVYQYYQSGAYTAQPARKTLANAMDVAVPSNLERLQNLYPDLANLKTFSQAFTINDDEIRQSIQKAHSKYNYVSCPHTATAFAALEKLSGSHWVVVSTAHPAKFDEIVEPILKIRIPVPESLEKILTRPTRYKPIAPTLEALKKSLPPAPSES